jgi:hypothetical protein
MVGIEKMKKTIKMSLLAAVCLSGVSLSASSTVTELENKIYQLEDRLDSVETKASLNKIAFSGILETKMSNIENKTGGKTYKDNGVFDSRMTLKMVSKVNDDVSFKGSLTYRKFWGADPYYNTSLTDSNEGRSNGDSTLYVERAYVDWHVGDMGGNVPTYLTVGRQPSSSGQSWQFQENGQFMGNYNSLMVDGAADGIVLTTKLGKYIPNTEVRLAYGKGYQETPKNEYETYNKVHDTSMTGLFIDSSLPLGKITNNIQLGLIKASDVSDIDMIKLMETFGYAQPAPRTVGDINLQGLLAEFPNIAGTGLSVFGNYVRSDATPKGAGVYNLIDRAGNAKWIGGKYDIPNIATIGYEYNRGSESFTNFTMGSHDSYNKLATRGTVHEVYVNKKFNEAIDIRIGYLDFDYNNGGSGNPLDAGQLFGSKDDSKKISYVNMKVSF